ncbi:MAG TPA: hypothetical protein VIV88_15370 [Gemmatimonadales bacterium]|jgi:plastocyanin
MTGGLPRRLLLGCAVPLLLGAGPASRRRHHVDIRDLEYRPRTLLAAVGDTIIWQNRDLVPHTVTFGEATDDRDEVLPGQRFTLVVAEHHSLRYRCRYHLGMTGMVLAT